MKSLPTGMRPAPRERGTLAERSAARSPAEAVAAGADTPSSGRARVYLLHHRSPTKRSVGYGTGSEAEEFV